MQNKLTDLCRNGLLQNDFLNTFCEKIHVVKSWRADFGVVGGPTGGGRGPERGYTLQEYLAHKTPPPVGPYSRTMPGDLWWPWGGGRFLLIEVLL